MGKKTGTVLGFSAAMLLLFGASAARADDSIGTSSTNAESFSHFYDNTYVNLSSVYHGAVLDNFTSPHTVDQTGNTSKATIYFDSDLTTAYLINKDIGIGPDIPFQYSPVLGVGFTLGDVGLKVFDKAAVLTPNLRIYTNFLIQAPTASFDSSRGMWTGFKMTPYVVYHLSGTRFTFGSWTEEKLYAGAYTGKVFKLYALPYANYQLTRSLSLNVGYEMETDHMAGKPTFDFTAYETDFQPGFVWQITPKLLINPYVQLFTGNRVGMDTTAFGAVINAALL